MRSRRAFLFACLSLLALFVAGCPPEDQALPVAAFSATPTAGAPGVEVQFSDESEAGSDPIVEWLWVFGDGGTSEEQHPSHVYAEAGAFDVALTVHTAAGEDRAVKVQHILVGTAPDTTAPVLTLNGPVEVSIECGEGDAFWDQGARAWDERDGDVPVMVSNELIFLRVPGDYVIRYAAVDRAGNAATPLTRIVHVVDTTPPSLVLKGGDVELSCGLPYIDPGVAMSDICGGTVDLEVEVTGPSTELGVHVLHYTAVDAAGNASETLTRSVSVVDDSAPIITLNGGDEVLECGKRYRESGARVYDDCEEDVALMISGEVPSGSTGAHRITYAATDSSGNVAEVQRVVHVRDSEPPVIYLLRGDLVVECGSAFEDSGAYALDGCDGEVSATRSDALSIGPETGAFEIRYEAVDAAGNRALSRAQNIVVVDRQPPVLEVIGGDVSIDRGSRYVDPGVTAMDACEGAVAVEADDHQVNIHVAGAYTVQYSARDSAGNIGLARRTVTVVEPCGESVGWARLYGAAESEEGGFRVLQTKDCGYLFHGGFGAQSLTNNLVKTDGGGNIVWSTVIPHVADDGCAIRVVDCVELPDGGLAVLATRRLGEQDVHPSLLYYSAGGESQGIQSFVEYGFFTPRRLACNDAGDCFIFGDFLEGAYYQTSPSMGLMTLRGPRDIVQFHTLAAGLAVEMVLSAAGNPVVLGARYSLGSGSGSRRLGAYLGEVLATGTVLWSRQMEFDETYLPVDLCRTADGGLVVIVTNEYGLPDYESETSVIRFDRAGEQLWTHVKSGWEQVTRVAPYGDGGIVLAGTTVPYPSVTSRRTDLLFYELNAAGEEQWSATRGGYGWEHEMDLIPTRDGGFLLTGDSNSYQEDCPALYDNDCYDALVIKAKKYGNIPLTPEGRAGAGYEFDDTTGGSQ
jgi:PKD repeat protein